MVTLTVPSSRLPGPRSASLSQPSLRSAPPCPWRCRRRTTRLCSRLAPHLALQILWLPRPPPSWVAQLEATVGGLRVKGQQQIKGREPWLGILGPYINVKHLART